MAAITFEVQNIFYLNVSPRGTTVGLLSGRQGDKRGQWCVCMSPTPHPTTPHHTLPHPCFSPQSWMQDGVRVSAKVFFFFFFLFDQGAWSTLQENSESKTASGSFEGGLIHSASSSGNTIHARLVQQKFGPDPAFWTAPSSRRVGLKLVHFFFKLVSVLGNGVRGSRMMNDGVNSGR